MIRSRLALLCLFLSLAFIGGCKPRAVSSSPATSMEMKPFSEPTYGAGIPLSDLQKCRQALVAAAKSRKLVKVPVVLHRAGDELRSYEFAYLGTSTDVPADQRTLILLHDSALGVSLVDRMAQYCPTGEWCRLWVVGYWGELPLIVEHGRLKDEDRLGLRHIVGPQAPDAQAMIYIAE